MMENSYCLFKIACDSIVDIRDCVHKQWWEISKAAQSKFYCKKGFFSTAYINKYDLKNIQSVIYYGNDIVSCDFADT